MESIAGMVANLPPVLRQALGFEYKSKTEWFGLPLVHIAYGMDLQTGKTRVAKGILAIGNVAKGVFAFGGAAYGVFAFGGFAVGLVTIAGCGIGLFSFAGLALALVAACGGLAVGPVAVGGFAVGYYVVGGAAIGAHALGGNANDPEARRFFAPIGPFWQPMLIAVLCLVAFAIVVPLLIVAWARSQATSSNAGPRARDFTPQELQSARASVRSAGTALLVIGLLNSLCLLPPALLLLGIGDIDESKLPLGAGEMFFWGACGCVIAYGGHLLKNLRHLELGYLTSVLAMIPLTSPLFIFGIPVGIWCLKLLGRPEVKEVFEQAVLPESAPVAQPDGTGRLSLGLALAGIVLPIGLLLMALAAQWNLSVHCVPDFFTLCIALSVVLELAALVCGIIGRSAKSGKAGILISGVSLMLCLIVAPTNRVQRGPTKTGSMNSQSPAPVPPLGTITNGIGAEFTVPASQVAIFEIVTRRDGATVPVPPHCGFVLAPAGGSIAGTFRWSRELEQNGGAFRRWRIKIVSGAGTGSTGGLALPEALDAAVGAMSLALGKLEPNEEIFRWGTPEPDNLPANGLIGLRITTVAHNLKAGGSGIAHTDWKQAQTKTKR